MWLGAEVLEAPGLLLLAVAIGTLGASDFRMVPRTALGVRLLGWNPVRSVRACAVLSLAAMLLLWPTAQAVRAQHAYLEAVELADMGRRQPLTPEQEAALARRSREAAAIDAGYTQWLLPLAENLLARARWEDAAALYEAALRSMPNDLSVASGAARAYAAVGDLAASRGLLDKALAARPMDPGLRSIQVFLEARAGQPRRSLALAREALDGGVRDLDLIDNATSLALEQGDTGYALQCLAWRLQGWPAWRTDTLMRIGHVHLRRQRDETAALHWYRQAMASVDPEGQAPLMLQIPPGLWAGLSSASDVPAPSWAPTAAAASQEALEPLAPQRAFLASPSSASR